MGCCGNSNIKYKDKTGQVRTLPMKDAKTIDRFKQGATARIKVKKMKTENARNIALLEKPSWQILGEEKKTLMTEKEFDSFMDSDGKGLTWNNYFTEVDKKSGKEYRGHWTKDRQKWEGLGEIKFSDSSLYQGMVKNKTFNGPGRMTHQNGDIYQGNWENGKANGKGTFVDSTGSIYDGDWVNDKQHGKGTEVWNEGKIKYTGDFVEGKKTGKGVFVFDGSRYDGDFVDGKFHGHGKYYFADSGKIYEGGFKDNNMCGNGVMIWPDQSRYEGEFKNGMMNGQGIKQLAAGNRYVGQFKDDQMHGTGIWYDVKDQSKRQGTWVNNKRYAWISERQQYHVSGYGEQTSTQPFAQRRSTAAGERLYRGGRWKDGDSTAPKVALDAKSKGQDRVTVKRVKRGTQVRGMNNEQAQHQAHVQGRAYTEPVPYDEYQNANGDGALHGLVIREMLQPVGHGSIHFDETYPYVSFRDAPRDITLATGERPPAKVYLKDAMWDPVTNSLTGWLDWSKNPLGNVTEKHYQLFFENTPQMEVTEKSQVREVYTNKTQKILSVGTNLFFEVDNV